MYPCAALKSWVSYKSKLPNLKFGYNGNHIIVTYTTIITASAAAITTTTMTTTTTTL